MLLNRPQLQWGYRLCVYQKLRQAYTQRRQPEDSKSDLDINPRTGAIFKEILK